MDHLCVRCARHALRAPRVSRPSTSQALVRHFTDSSAAQAGPIDLSAPIGESSTQSRSSAPNPKKETPRPAQPRSDPASEQPRFTIRRTFQPESRAPPGVLTRSARPPPPRIANREGPPGNVLIRRTGPRSEQTPNQTGTPPSPPLNILRRAPNRDGTRPGPPGQFNRGPIGSRPPFNRTPSGGPRTGGPRTGGSGPRTPRPRSGDKPKDTAIDEDTLLAHQIYDTEQHNLQLNNGLPQLPTPYIPADPSLTELRKDWPDTPLSATGLAESVVQKLNFLARDLPHGYWTPKQIAERLLQGDLVKFETPEQKKTVMGYAVQLCEEKAGVLEKVAATAEEGRQKEYVEGKAKMYRTQAEAIEREWVSVGSKEGERNGLVDVMVKGVYPTLKEGQRPLLASVYRQLRNNETYDERDTGKLVGRIESLIAGFSRQGGGQQAEAVRK